MALSAKREFAEKGSCKAVVARVRCMRRLGRRTTSYTTCMFDTGENLHGEASYVCESCGEEIVIPIDELAGAVQEYVEDCPVCCRPHLLRIELDQQFGPHIHARAE